MYGLLVRLLRSIIFGEIIIVGFKVLQIAMGINDVPVSYHGLQGLLVVAFLLALLRSGGIRNEEGPQHCKKGLKDGEAAQSIEAWRLLLRNSDRFAADTGLVVGPSAVAAGLNSFATKAYERTPKERGTIAANEDDDTIGGSAAGARPPEDARFGLKTSASTSDCI